MNIETKRGLASKHKLKLTDDQLSNVEFIYCDDDRNSLQVNGTIVVFKEPVYLVPGIRLCPLYPQFGVDEFGNVYDGLMPLVPTIPTSTKYYPEVRPNTHHRIRNHRASASAWCLNDDPIKRHTVNHKDGNKHNFDSSNLEWVTQKENVDHAFDTGLMVIEVPCACLDVMTGEIREFPNISDLAAAVGSTYGVAVYYLRNHDGDCLLNNRYELKYLSDKSDWVNPVIGKLKPSSKYNIFVTYPDGRVEPYWNLAEFDTKFNGYSCMRGIDFIMRKVNKKHPHLVFDYTLRYPDTEFEIKCKRTGSIRMTKNIDDVVRATNRSRTYIMNLMGTDRVCDGPDDYIRVKSHAEWKIPEFIGNVQRTIRVTNMVTKVSLVFRTVKSIAEELECATATIRNRLRDGTMYKNFKFEILKERRT